MGNPRHHAHRRLGPRRRSLHRPGVLLVEHRQHRKQDECHEGEERMDHQQADERQHDECHHGHRVRDGHQHRSSGLDVGVGVGEELPGGAGAVERQRGVEVVVEDGEAPGALGPCDGREVEEPPHHHRDAPYHADRSDCGRTGECRVPVDASAVEAREDQFVGDAPQHDRVADDSHGEDVCPGDAEEVRQGVRTEGPQYEAATAPEDAIPRGRRRTGGVRVGQRAPVRTPSTSPRWPRP